MGDHKNFNDNLIPDSPQSEQFWLPSVSAPDDLHVVTEDLVSDVDSGDASPVLDITAARCGTLEDCSLRMEDDTPLCSIIEGADQSKKPMSAVFRLHGGKKSRSRKERLSVKDSVTYSSPPSSPKMASNLFFAPSGRGDPLMQDPTISRHKKKEKSKPKHPKGKSKSTSEEKSKTREASEEARGEKKRRKSKQHRTKVGIIGMVEAEADVGLGVDKTLLGVPLEEALKRNPSHDGVPIPAFVRHLIDFVEEYGLAVEGIYRVPGVNSQVKLFINALNDGVDFPKILPSSPGFSGYDATPKTATANKSSTIVGSDSISPPITSSAPPPPPQPPHDPAVVTSVLKHFLRSLPEPLLTSELAPAIESIAADTASEDRRRRRIAELVHRSSGGLPRPNRYLLAWLLQHMSRVIEHAADNRMTLANLVIVFSPTLRMSHRLLALLLSQPAVGEPAIEPISDAEAPRILSSPQNTSSSGDISSPHWLFPNAVYAYRVYKPPLPPPPPSLGAEYMLFDLPDSLAELEAELFKQESLLAFLQRPNAGNNEAIIREVQNLVTKMRRKKALLELTDSEAIRAELERQETRLEHVKQELVQLRDREDNSTAAHNAEPTSTSERASKSVSSRLPVSQFDQVASPSKPRRRSTASKKSRSSAAQQQSLSAISNALDAEFWELQQTVTMLKRRLKQCQAPKTIGQSHSSPRRLEIVPTDSLDAEEVFNFALRKPAAPVEDQPSPLAQQTHTPEDGGDSLIQSSQNPPPPLEMTLEPVAQKQAVAPFLSPRVETFPVEWPTTSPPLPPEEEPAEESPPAATEASPPLDPASQYLLSIHQYWKVRQQELLACQHDLKSRIRSQQAEIARIEMSINQMVSSGNVHKDQVRRYFAENEHLLKSTGQTTAVTTTLFGSAELDDKDGETDVEDDDEEEEEEEEEDDEDEVELAATLLQLMRDNARLEALNASHIENIIAERDSCAHLKVQLRLSTCVGLPPLSSETL